MPNLTRRALSALPLAALPGLAAAQAFPAKPVRLICPFPPGGAVDIASRAVADDAVPLKEVFSLHVAVEIERQWLGRESAGGGEEQDGRGKMHACDNFGIG